MALSKKEILSTYTGELKSCVFETMRDWKPTGTKIVTGESYRSVRIVAGDNGLEIKGNISVAVMEYGANYKDGRVRKKERIISAASDKFIDEFGNEIANIYVEGLIKDIINGK